MQADFTDFAVAFVLGWVARGLWGFFMSVGPGND